MDNNSENTTVLFGTLDVQQVIDENLDATGLLCPLPLLQMKLKLKSMTQGQVLNVLTSDVTSVKDFRRFCELSEHQLLLISQSQGQFQFHIKKG